MEDKMTDTQNIYRRPDGSIDTGYYLERGRCRRSHAAHEMASRAGKKTRGVLVGLKAFLTFLFYFGGQGPKASTDDTGT